MRKELMRDDLSLKQHKAVLTIQR